MLELKEQTILMIIMILPSLLINVIGNSYFLPTLGGIATAYTALFSALVYCILTSLHFIYSIKKNKFI
jgi:antibiotic biosynthesis monooxygenase (ABM) superfamily enzyme